MSTKIKQKRTKPIFYRLVPLKSEDGSEQLVTGEKLVCEGELEEHVIVSVPETMSHRAAQELEESLTREFERPIIIVTHNVSFMKVKKLSAIESMELAKRVIYGATQANKPIQENAGQDEMGREPAKVFPIDGKKK